MHELTFHGSEMVPANEKENKFQNLHFFFAQTSKRIR